MDAPSATPRYLPPDFAPVPARIEATCVAEVVATVRRAGEVGLADLAAGEVRVGLVHARVDHRDRDARTGVARRPRCRGADLRDAVVQ
jgi:hypothetical protein